MLFRSHFGAIRLNIENVIRNFEQASSPDVKMYISKARVIEKLREADTMLQSIPKG